MICFQIFAIYSIGIAKPNSYIEAKFEELIFNWNNFLTAVSLCEYRTFFMILYGNAETERWLMESFELMFVNMSSIRLTTLFSPGKEKKKQI